MNQTYYDIIHRFRQQKVLVIGDLILDIYLKGSTTRLSPDAPVPVVNVANRQTVLGGAGNAAANLRLMGATVTCCSLVGEDADACLANQQLTELGITASLIACPDRETIVKTRIMANDRILARYDAGTETVACPADNDRLKAWLSNTWHHFDAILIADYNKGMFTPELIRLLEELIAQHRPFIAIDSKQLAAFKRLQPSLTKPNYPEVLQLLNTETAMADRQQFIRQEAQSIYDQTQAAITAVTLDQDGAVILEEGVAKFAIDAPQISHPNVSGAGDTYISAFTLSMLSGATIQIAAEIAGAAAAVAVNKQLTACCNQKELIAYFSMSEKLVNDMEQLQYVCELHKAQGKKIVFTNGCFDILHSGHVSYLERARQLGDILIVGINNDESIRRLKGSERPVNQLPDRIQVLAGLSAVNYVIPFGNETDDTPASLIRIVCPDVFAKGGDYNRDNLPEASLLESLGTAMVFLPLVPGRSTSIIIRQINNQPLQQLIER
ncbi:adenylyltransferase/cytidyltransferase family protein [Chitinophaga pendula]|uniref:PfkB family carbohydrate kinase n=1 Tax=Chitinophaga TaxID=79328 RepID=UPI0018E04290|nr:MULTISPECIES: PfkB family carbohydrate kinase [Chitinophaga]UCJ08553.1 adenylyltransferase/cytidyltransferase family protein [Chitinophaga pendula]